jgi:hypothetical protein
LKGIFLQLKVFKVAIGLVSSNSRVEESHVSLQRKAPMIEAAVSTIEFSCENEVVFERNTSFKKEFSRW